MTSGLTVINDNGKFQITDEDQNYHLVEKGSFSLSGGFYAFSRSGRTAPLLALRSATRVGIGGGSLSGGSFTANVYSPTSSPTPSVDFWLFDRRSAAPGNFGLEVYRPDSSIAFSSGAGPLRIVGALAISAFTNASASYPAGRTYAAIQTVSGYAQDSEQIQSGPDLYRERRCLGMASWSGVSIDARRNFTDTKTSEVENDFPGFTFAAQPPGWVICDVTGF